MPVRRPRPAVPTLLLALIAPFAAGSAQAQATAAPPAQASAAALPQSASTPLTQGPLLYIGSDHRVSVGVDQDGKLHGEWLGVLHEQGDSAWLGEAWFSRSAGGAQLNFHQQRAGQDSVLKYFGAIDQNATRDRKLTLGLGLEQANWFGNAYVSRGMSGQRLVQQSTASSVSTQTGEQDGRPYVDTVTRLTTTRVFERAYDYGVGLRAGHYYAASDLRLTAGLDHEWGRGGARQSSLSLAMEKFFTGTPHSVALQLDHYHKVGELETQRNDTRVLLSYRYSFGATSSRPAQLYRMVEQPRTVVEPTVIPARSEQKLIKTKAIMTSDAFFDLASAKLTPLAREELDRIAAMMKSAGREGNVRIVGHTCDLGSDKFNDKLSLQRAEAVRDYLVATGVLALGEVVLEGKGKREPKFPVTPATREKNRRVDLEFLSFVEKTEVVEIPAQVILAVQPPVTFEREEIAQEPAWMRRSLRLPAVHKRTVDVYRSKEETQAQETTRVWVNRVPQAQSDVYSVMGGSITALAVLSNDSDADVGDVLKLESVSAPLHGQARIEGDKVVYTAPTDFTGQDRFDYVVKDSQGASSRASVLVNVAQAVANHAPVARDDAFVVSGAVPTTLAVLANDQDPDGDPISITAVTQPVAGHGAVAVVGSQIVFTPAHYFGSDSFTYTISDGRGGLSTATVRVVDP